MNSAEAGKVRQTYFQLIDKSAQIWKELPDDREMIITSNGRPIAILASISESNLEESLAAFRLPADLCQGLSVFSPSEFLAFYKKQ